MGKVFITNGKIVDVLEQKSFTGSILVEDDIIKAVGTDLAAPADAEVIDLGGKTVTPGLFNCHVHITMADKQTVPEQPETDAGKTLQALVHMRQLIESGVTFARSVGDSNYIDIDLRDAAKRDKVLGPDLYVCGKCVCMTGGHGWTNGREVDGPDEARKGAREQLRAGADGVKVMATGGVMTKGVEPGSVQLGEDELRAAIEEAHKVGAKTATHAQGTSGIKNAIRAGIDSIEHGCFLDDEAIQMMLDQGTYLVATLCAPYWILEKGKETLPDYVLRKTNYVIESHFASFKKAKEAGVKIAMGTDAGTPYNTFDNSGFELVLACQNGMTPMEAITAATINSADLCDVEKTMGSITEGKKANLAVFEKCPLEDINNVLDCCMTIKNGKVLYSK